MNDKKKAERQIAREIDALLKEQTRKTEKERQRDIIIALMAAAAGVMTAYFWK